jgi:hypothetical protein
VAGSPAPYTSATCEPSGTKLLIVAKADEFSLNCMAVATGTPTTITLVNKDSSSHNLAIYEDPEVGVLMRSTKSGARNWSMIPASPASHAASIASK